MASKQAYKAFQELLNANGFPVGTADGVVGPKTRAGALRFQRAFAGGRGGLPLLQRSGAIDDATLKAAAELPYLSANFKATEFRCKDNRCQRAWVLRELVIALEAYRRHLGGPVNVVSGYRCPTHNTRVGGAKASQHAFAAPDGSGGAADIPGQLSTAQVKALGVFGGLGFKASTGRVTHVDVRQVNKANPTIWRYSS